MKNSRPNLFLRIINFGKRKCLNWYNLIIDEAQSTYSFGKEVGAGEINTFFRNIYSEREITDQIIANYLNHQFNLLGSGWTVVAHGSSYKGAFGARYDSRDGSVVGKSIQKPKTTLRNRSKSDWHLSHISDTYKPIDWQVDFKSGFRWSERTNHRWIRKAHKRGVDIKVPWELARCYHLPQLAVAYCDKKSSYYCSSKLPDEFRNQVLDFCGNNPPRYGVNWASPMEVAIRISNWLIAWDLFSAAGYEFDSEFICLFESTIVDHGRHIYQNLEWHNSRRANHYLADLVGLSFCSAYLSRSIEAEKWRKFSIEQLIIESKHQFLSDGSSFEASTCYHRLTTEFIIYATAAHVAAKRIVPESTSMIDSISTIFGHEYLKKIGEIFQCLEDISKERFELPQIGDNDGGRLFKLSSNYVPPSDSNAGKNIASFSIENQLNCNDTLEAGRALIGFEKTRRGIEYEIVSQYMGYKVEKIDLPRIHSGITFRDTGVEDFQLELNKNGINSGPTQTRSFNIGLEHRKCQPKIYYYQGFGFIYKSSWLYLLVRCLLDTDNIHDAHLHSDQLALELEIDGVSYIADPGSYIYTASLHHRNRYRGVVAHDTPWPSTMPDKNNFRKYFGGISLPQMKYVSASLDGFEGIAKSGDIAVARKIEFKESKIVIRDWNSEGAAPGSSPPPYSPGYGQVLKEI